MVNFRKGPRPKAKKRVNKDNFISKNFNSHIKKRYYKTKSKYSLTPILQFISDFKWLILGLLGIILLFAIIPGNLWVLAFFIIISYVTNLVDAFMRLPFKIETGIAMIVMLVAANAPFIYVLMLLLIGLVLPHIQTSYFFRPLSLMLYAWLIILLKIVGFMPFGFLANAIIGLFFFNMGFFALASINGSSLPFSRAVWSFVKNLIIVVLVYNLGIMSSF